MTSIFWRGSATSVLIVIATAARGLMPMPEAYCDGEGILGELQCDLARAMTAEDLPGIRRIVGEAYEALGADLALPEVAERFSPVAESESLPAGDIAAIWKRYLVRIEADAYWRNFPKPETLPGPLRGLSDFIIGILSARRAGLDPGDHGLALAREMGEYLLWAQAQGGAGVFGVPDLRGKTGRVPGLVARFLARADAAGVTGRVLKNGWLIDDWGGGDLQFDNGLAGVALLGLHETTGESKYLDSARAAGEWAMSQACVPNWNYNSFSVLLLAELHRVTQESRYLDAAKHKTRIGVLPGLILAGPKAGRWGDPHNARLVYHYILCRGMAALLRTMPGDDPERAGLRDALIVALQTRNTEIIERGVANPDTALEVLSRVLLGLGGDRELVAKSRCGEALDVLDRYISERVRNNQLPVGATPIGLLLELNALRREN